MIKRIYIVVLLILVVGCSKSSKYGSEADDNIVDDKISYRVTDLDSDWTRGTSIDSTSDIGDMLIYGVRYSGDRDNHYMYIDAMTASKSSSSDVWSFATTQYYPVVGDELNFWACTPLPIASSLSNDKGNGVTYSFDLETAYDDQTDYNDKSEVLRVDYTAPTTDARNQPDILVGKAIGSTTSSANLVFSHMLTKVSLSAKLSSAGTDNTYLNRYVITRFTMQHIATKGTLLLQGDNVISSNDSGDWIIDQSQRETVITSTAYTLADPIEDEDVAVVLDATDYQYAMIDSEGNKQALFMIPQRIDGLPENIYPDKPTIYVTLYDKVNLLYYRTSEIELPTPNGIGWNRGEHVNLRVTIDPASTILSASMTIVPVILGWYDHEIDVEIDESITLWCDVNEISSGGDAIVKVYTNCSSISASVSEGSCTVGDKVDSEYFPVTITGAGASAGAIKLSVTAENAYTSETLTKNFTLTVN